MSDPRSAPRRPPCGGWIGVIKSGNLFRHKMANDSTAIHAFDAKVPAVSGPNVDPSPRYDTSDTPCGGGSSCDEEVQPCGPWIGVGEHQYNNDNPPPSHFSLTGATQDFSFCHKRGHKKVMAHRNHHGARPFTDPFYKPISEYDWPDTLPGPRCTRIGPLAGANQTRYLSVDVSMSWDADSSDCDSGTTGYGTSGGFSASVNRNSGVGTLSSWSEPSFPSGMDQPIGDDPLISSVSDTGFGKNLAGQNLATITPLFLFTSYLPGSGFAITRAGNVTSVTFDDGTDSVTMEEVTCDIAGGNFERKTYGAIPNSCYEAPDNDGTTTWGLVKREAYTVSATEINYILEYFVFNIDGNPSPWHGTLTCDVVLSGENEAEDVRQDALDLLGQWDLSDDKSYPWRTDGYLNFGPLVCRNEVAGNVDVTSLPLTSGWVDPNAALFDGSILGSPLPAGYQGAFDYYYQDWRTCFDPPTGANLWYILQYGKKNVGQMGLPLNATHWPNAFELRNKPGCAFEMFNMGAGIEGGVNGDGYWCMKSAEILELWPSYNFARPNGSDRFAFDEEKVYCVYSTSGSDVTLTDSSGDTGVTPSSGIYGGLDVDGFFNCTFTGNVAHLGTKFSELPTGWNKSGFGKLRFPNVPGLAGRVGVSRVENFSPVKLTTEAAPYLAMDLTAAEHIDICDINMTVLASNVAITRGDDAHFTVPTAYATIANAKWIVVHGAAKWYMNDTSRKGDYVYTENLFAYRDFGEYSRLQEQFDACDSDNCSLCGDAPDEVTTVLQEILQEQGCLPFQPCNPIVLCISPNGEEFANGATRPFPEDFSFDELYGSRWQAEFHQTMDDPLWQSPHTPCGDSSQIEDDGSCSGDYAHRPLFEARLTVPNDYSGGESGPALPSGTYLGWISYAESLSGAPGHVLFPVDPADVYPTPWGFHELAEGCVCGGGTFASEYEAAGIRCVT